MPPCIRINKLLSQLGIASRRKADELIRRGKVILNGEVLLTPGVLVDTQKDTLRIYGKPVLLNKDIKRIYLLLNKPCGYITTLTDTHARKTVMDLVPKRKGLFPVGRLDKDTIGLLIVTNDGELAHRMMHPRFRVEKRYEVVVSGAFRRGDIEKLVRGVDIGDKRLSICNVHNIARLKGSTAVLLEVHEGRKRQIRRTMEALGYKVLSLKRVAYAGLRLDVKEGAYRQVTAKELESLKSIVGFK